MHMNVLYNRMEKKGSHSASDKEDREESAIRKPHTGRRSSNATKIMNPLWRADRLRFVVSDTSSVACKAFRSKDAIAAEKKEIAQARKKKAKESVMAEYLRRTYDPAELRAVQARANKPVFSQGKSPLGLSHTAVSDSITDPQPSTSSGRRGYGPPIAVRRPEVDSGNEMDMAPDSEEVATRVYEIVTPD